MYDDTDAYATDEYVLTLEQNIYKDLDALEDAINAGIEPAYPDDLAPYWAQ